MSEKIAWSDRAERAYGQIIDYVADEFGVTRAKRYAKEVYEAVGKLPENPKMGQIEPLLEGSRYEFRRLVYKTIRFPLPQFLFCRPKDASRLHLSLQKSAEQKEKG